MEAFGSFTITIPAPGKRLATSESKKRLPDGIHPSPERMNSTDPRLRSVALS